MCTCAYSLSYNLTPPISRVRIGQHFCSQRHQRVVTCLENVCELNERRGKKLGFQLSHRQPLHTHMLARTHAKFKIFNENIRPNKDSGQIERNKLKYLHYLNKVIEKCKMKKFIFSEV